MPVALYAYGSKSLFRASRPLIRGWDHLTGFKYPKNDLEEWDYWINQILINFLEEKVSGESKILNYIDENFVKEVFATKNIESMAKLVTVEVILELIDSKWN